MRIALFDLDGTLTRHDTLFTYVLGFCLRHPLRLPRLLAMPWHVARYLFRGHDRAELKEALITTCLRGVTRDDIARWNQSYVASLVRSGLNSSALARALAHRARGDYLVLMSASPDLYVPAIARALRFNETICTGVQWNGMVLDGRLTTPNRQGDEKAQCVEALRRRNPGCHITGYGNSVFDLAHLRLCDSAHMVNASPRSAQEAARIGVSVGWPLDGETSTPRSTN